MLRSHKIISDPDISPETLNHLVDICTWLQLFMTETSFFILITSNKGGGGENHITSWVLSISVNGTTFYLVFQLKNNGVSLCSFLPLLLCTQSRNSILFDLHNISLIIRLHSRYLFSPLGKNTCSS